jgi:hypothetical protein
MLEASGEGYLEEVAANRQTSRRLVQEDIVAAYVNVGDRRKKVGVSIEMRIERQEMHMYTKRINCMTDSCKWYLDRRWSTL